MNFRNQLDEYFSLKGLKKELQKDFLERQILKIEYGLTQHSLSNVAKEFGTTIDDIELILKQKNFSVR